MQLSCALTLSPCPRDSTSPEWCRSREPFGEQTFDVLQELLCLVPAVEDAHPGGALPAGVRSDDDGDLGSSRTCCVGGAERFGDRVGTVEDGDVDGRLENGFRQPLG